MEDSYDYTSMFDMLSIFENQSCNSTDIGTLQETRESAEYLSKSVFPAQQLQLQPVKSQQHVIQKSQCTNSSSSSSEPKSSGQRKRWSKEEHNLFLDAVSKLGLKQKSKLSEFIPGRDPMAVISHSQKFFVKLQNAYDRSVKCDPKEATLVYSKYLLPCARQMDYVLQNPKHIDPQMKQMAINRACCGLCAVRKICEVDNILAEFCSKLLEKDEMLLRSLLNQ
ncbi:Myb-like_DNA-binding domain-containing protein [Hexamita inflata]|uniref:Myb-like DNA-binding domain-containing protein n=1 Tax=Hexamita inflata TaxID=28002 RepID=A0AA86NJR1_9EUKA|nr:Myb-like DNA-binding domain-containing protein [Hexamita inflata]CAI9920415.1 Myb-like DNA-binding domain-containing protein [Hexamita inflata]CAI9920417.1 Myb-like DNA-binding domain-containing protein [Hexamita inflata]CAI9975067.1 Myb-like DNA-binding domain-containing protein [Hexamita inflata]